MTILTELKLNQKQKTLTLAFDNAATRTLSCQCLRESSPAADAKTTAITDDVTIIGIDPVGHYAVRLIFSDGYQNGLYTFDYLAELAEKKGTVAVADA